MKRINLRDVPDETYETLVECAEEAHQSLNAFVVDRLVEMAKTASIAEYLDRYEPPTDTGLDIDDAVAAVRAAREER